jgi:hypothetical protein
VPTFAAHLDRGDADHRADTSGEPVDDLAVADIDGSPDPVFAGFRLGVDGRQPKTGDARLVEKTAERGMYVVCAEFQNKHGLSLFR